jgi:hypothetical protein
MHYFCEQRQDALDDFLLESYYSQILKKNILGTDNGFFI